MSRSVSLEDTRIHCSFSSVVQLSPVPWLSYAVLRGRGTSYPSLSGPLTHSTGADTGSVCVDRTVCEPHLRTQLPATTLPCMGPPAAQGDPAICFHTLSQEETASPFRSSFQTPELVNSPLLAAECPGLAAGNLGSPVVSHAPAAPMSPPPAQTAPQRPRPSPGPGVAAELVHVWVVLGQDGDGVTLLPDDEPGLLLRGTP